MRGLSYNYRGVAEGPFTEEWAIIKPDRPEDAAIHVIVLSPQRIVKEGWDWANTILSPKPIFHDNLTLDTDAKTPLYKTSSGGPTLLSVCLSDTAGELLPVPPACVPGIYDALHGDPARTS